MILWLLILVSCFICSYCVSVFATDGNAEAEFVLFDKVAAGAVGKSLISILRQRYPGYAKVDDMANVARHDTTIPPEITQLVGQKFRLMVSISKKWKFKNSENLSFQVNRIEETYKPELPPLVLTAAGVDAAAGVQGEGAGAQGGGRAGRGVPRHGGAPAAVVQRRAADDGRGRRRLVRRGASSRAAPAGTQAAGDSSPPSSTWTPMIPPG